MDWAPGRADNVLADMPVCSGGSMPGWPGGGMRGGMEDCMPG
jgi:hypothetical protein